MDKIIIIDKPQGWTSFDVVAKVRGIVKKNTGQKRPRVGHAGTLDPLATGLLIVLVGSATKRQAEFMNQDKIYQVQLRLGETSTTDDQEGEKTKVSDVEPALGQVEAVVDSFVGEIKQVPPVFSAIKVSGQRAYKLARQGRDIKLEPRKVTVYYIAELEYNYPYISFTTKVSSGTYIRSLVRDIGQKLASGAYMSGLRRTQIGEVSISDAVTPSQLSQDYIKKLE